MHGSMLIEINDWLNRWKGQISLTEKCQIIDARRCILQGVEHASPALSPTLSVGSTCFQRTKPGRHQLNHVGKVNIANNVISLLRSRYERGTLPLQYSYPKLLTPV